MVRYAVYVLLVCIMSLNLYAGVEKNPLNKNAFLLQAEKLGSIDCKHFFTGKSELQEYTVTLNQRSAVFGAGITADVKLLNDAGLVRVILNDSYGNEHLVYEVYSLLVDQKSFSVKNACEETKVLNAVTPVSLRIELFDASISIQKLNVVTEVPYSWEQIRGLQSQTRKEQEIQKITLLNTQIKKNGMSWIAGQTSLSSLTYSEKRDMFNNNGMLANLQGYEYYAGGIFECKSNEPETVSPDNAPKIAVVDTFDWRTRHGANNSKSPYYDGDANGGGWATSIKDQASPQYCGSCWAHSTMAAAEMMCNLYYNHHIDMDLAEQYLMECSNACTAGKGCGGGNQGSALKWVATKGAMEEAAFPYKASDDPVCGDSSKTPKEHLTFATGNTLPKFTSEDSLKSYIVHNGPINVGVSSMSHAMCMLGYTKNTSGQTAWIFKNSHGLQTGVKGYSIIVKPLSDFSVSAYGLPPTSRLYTKDSIRCADLDKDGYYNWGIGPKPATCPECSNEEDCDDSRNDLGPMAPDGSCKQIVTGVVLNPLPNSELLYKCSPNPFRSYTTICFKLQKDSKAKVQMYNMSGSLIKNLYGSAGLQGLQKLVWDGRNAKGALAGTGTYICRIEIENTYSRSVNSFKIIVSR